MLCCIAHLSNWCVAMKKLGIEDVAFLSAMFISGLLAITVGLFVFI